MKTWVGDWRYRLKLQADLGMFALGFPMIVTAWPTKPIAIAAPAALFPEIWSLRTEL
jgi:hypothetical protein